MAENTPLGSMVIDVDLNTTKLNSSVTGLQRQMRMVNSAMRSNLSVFGQSGKEADKLGSKIDGLTKKEKIQAAIVKEAQKNYETLAKEKGENAKETEAYASTLNKEQAKLNEITNELKELERQHKVMTSPWTKLSEGMDKYGDRLKTIGDGMKNIGKLGTMYITAPIVGAFAASTKAAIDFESAFAGVRKTVDASEAEYTKLSNGIREMSKELPASANEIANVMEMGGQLGIHNDNLLEFTRTIIDLGEATNMTTEQAATQFAQFANIMGMSQTEFDNFGSTIVELGNNMATTESDIMSMSMRLAGTGNQIGLTESEVAALAATMSSVGIEAEAGGSAMSMTMKKMQNAVADGGAELEGFAKVVGMSTSEFAQAFENDPMSAITAFIAGLEESGASGENLNAVLENLGITGIRETDTLLRLAGDSELLSQAVDMASDAWSENSALSKEAQERYETMASQLSILRNHIVDLGIDIGEILLPYLEKFVNFAVNLAEKISNLSDNQKLLGVAIASIAAAIPPVLLGMGIFISLIGSTLKTLAPLSATIAKNGGLLKILGMAFGGLTNPVGIAVTVIGLLVSAFTIAYAKSETFRDGVHSVGEKVSEIWGKIQEFGNGVKHLFAGNTETGSNILTTLGISEENVQKIIGLKNNILEVKDKVLELGQTIAGQVRPALDSVMSFIGEIGTRLTRMWNENSAAIIPIVTFIGNIITTVFSGILSTINFIMPAVFTIIKMVWQNIQGVIRGALNVIEGLVKLFSGIFTGDFSKMWEAVKQIFTGAIQLVWNGFQLLFYGRILKGVGSLVTSFSGLIRGLWTTVVNFFRNMADDAALRVMYMRDGVVNFIRAMNTRVNSIVSGLVKSVFNFFRNMLNNSTQTANNLGLRVWNLFRTMGIRVTGVVRSLFNSVRSFFSNMLTTVRSTVTNLKNTAVNLFTTLMRQASNIVRSLYNSVRNFFSNMFTSVRGTVSNLRNNVVNLFSNMRSNVTNGVTNLKNRVSTLFNNIKDNAKKAFENMVKGAKELPGKLGNAIKNGRQKAVDGIKNMGNSMITQLEKVVNGLIKGLNNITNKIGITATISEWNAPKFSTGTGASNSLVSNGAIAKDTLATVGDKGRGNGKGTRELVQYPNGTTGLYDNDATIFAPKGTIIHSNRQTEAILDSLPAFSEGTQAGSGAKDGNNKKNKKGLWGNIKDIASNVWDYIKQPSKVLNAIVDNIAPDFSGLKGFAGTVAKGGFNFVKDKALDWITGIFKDNEGGEVNGGGILNRKITARFGTYPPAIAAQLGVKRHYGLDTAHKYEKLTSPVTGKVTKVWHDTYGGNAIQIKAGDLNWWFMHMQSIARKVGDMVKAGQTNLGVTGNTGLRTTGYHLHSQAMKGGIGNGFAIDPLPLLKKNGFATGGLVGNGIYNLGEEGYPEWVIPTDPKRRTDAMKLLAYAGKSLQKNNGNLRPHNLPEVDTDGMSKNEINDLKEIVKNQQAQIEQNNKMVELMMKMVDKEYVALYNEKKLAKDLEPEITRRSKYNTDRDARFS